MNLIQVKAQESLQNQIKIKRLINSKREEGHVREELRKEKLKCQKKTVNGHLANHQSLNKREVKQMTKVDLATNTHIVEELRVQSEVKEEVEILNHIKSSDMIHITEDNAILCIEVEENKKDEYAVS